LGGFTVGDGARIGSNAVVTKPVPAGATAVGNPARIILADAQADNLREAAAQRMGFSAYGVTASDDPISTALRGLIDTCARQEQQIAQLSLAIEQLSSGQKPDTRSLGLSPSTSETEKLNRLIE
jgi:serine O-acetyltransferase